MWSKPYQRRELPCAQGPSGPPKMGLLFEKAYRVFFKVLEHGKGPDSGYWCGRQNGLSAKALGLLEVSGYVIDLGIDGHVVVRFVSERRNVTTNSTSSAGRDHPGRSHLLDGPAQELAIELLGFSLSLQPISK